MRAALRLILYVVAALSALLCGGLCWITLHETFRVSVANYPGLAAVGIFSAVSVASLWLRSLVQPRFHWQRVQARRARWAEQLSVASFYVYGLITAIGVVHARPLAVAMIALAIVLGTVLLIHYRTRPEEFDWDGLCPLCGYDLRGASEPRCSECGAALQNFQPRP